jgi:hypothetical protein
MSRKRKRERSSPSDVTELADWIPPESQPHKYYSRLVFANQAGGSGPLGMIGQELQLVWYQTKADRDKERHGKLVSVLEFRNCRRSQGPLGDGYHFTAVLIEDLSGEYREWAGHQAYQGRTFEADAEVLETEVHFSVFLPETTSGYAPAFPAARAPFLLHRPDVQELSSPQLDLLFNAMNALYRSIPAMRLLEELDTPCMTERTERKPGGEGQHAAVHQAARATVDTHA